MRRFSQGEPTRFHAAEIVYDVVQQEGEVMKVYIVSDDRDGEWHLFPQAVFSTREKADAYKAHVESYDLGKTVDVQGWEIDRTDDEHLDRLKAIYEAAK